MSLGAALLSQEGLEDPYAIYRELRSSDPIHWEDSRGVWILTRFQDCKTALNHPKLSNLRGEGLKSQVSPELQIKMEPLFKTLSNWMVFQDAPKHTRLRKLVMKAFTPKFVSGLQPQIQATIDQLLEGKRRFDIVQTLARPLPAHTVGKMLITGRKDYSDFTRWAADLNAYFGPANPDVESASVALKSLKEMSDLFALSAEERRKRPSDDLISAMVTSDETHVPDEEELFGTCALLLFAGAETTTKLIANAMRMLLSRRDLLEDLKQNPSIMDTAIDEFLRFESPVQLISRVALEDFSFEGKDIKKGHRLFLFLGAANRDPEAFDDPEVLNLRRKDSPHLAFGRGPHFCIGFHLAKLEASLAVQTLIHKYPDLRLEDIKENRKFLKGDF